MRFEPMGMTANADIRIAKSVVDYIFRWLGITFLPGYKEANAGLNPPTVDKPIDTNSGNTAIVEPPGVIPRPTAVPSGNGSVDLAALERAGVALKPVPPAETFSSRSEQFAQFQTDAPSCDVCGAITIRNGTCYLCFNCGNSMGCS
jgi:ribonucleoside-diphosphate reductase alpha chain